MVNIDDFIKRLEIILDYYGLNASSFADKIGVQRSSLSHLLSGRNKPSLDFILKILDVFPEIDLYWILNGKGIFPKPPETTLPIASTTENTTVKDIKFDDVQKEVVADLFTDFIDPLIASTTGNIKNVAISKDAAAHEIESIMVFYKNGTFKQYNPK